MKIEKVKNNKIKVTLTIADLILYDIEADKIKPDSPELHKFLFDVMESVREETGFNPYNGQVVVEAAQHEGGIVLFISKLRSVTYRDKKRKRIKSGELKAKRLIRKRRYMFKSFDALCDALVKVDFSQLEESSLYKYENSWYVISSGGSSEAHCIFSEFCDELGEIVLDEIFLDEHGELIAEKKSLVSMANGIKTLD